MTTEQENMPLISVIIPIYKVENYLERCVNSVRNQTYGNLEIILVDDGSPDKCPELCDNYALLDSRIRVIHKENGGLSSARNAGLDIAGGEYIGFIDSDDWIIENAYEVLMSVMLSEPGCDIVQCGYQRVASEADPYEQRSGDVCCCNGKDMIGNIYVSGSGEAVVVCNKLYKRKCFLNIRFPEGITHEDEATTYRLFFSAEKVAVVDKVMYLYYQNNAGITGARYTVKHLDYLKSLEMRISDYEKWGMHEFAAKDRYYYMINTLNNYCSICLYARDAKYEKKQLISEYRKRLSDLNKCSCSSLRRGLFKLYGILPPLYFPEYWMRKKK